MKDFTEFENTFKIMWKTAKEKNISKNDIGKETKENRKENNFLKEIQKRKMK